MIRGIQRRHALMVGCIGVFAAGATQAHAAVLTTEAVQDIEASIGTVSSSIEGSPSINVRDFSEIIDEQPQYGIAEFDISELSLDTLVQSATLDLNIVQFTQGGNAPPTSVSVRGFVGDGQATITDFDEDAPILGTGEIDGLGNLSIDLASQPGNGLISTQEFVDAQSGFLGVILGINPSNTQYSFSTIESMTNPGPTLSVTYVPEPATAGLLLAGLGGLTLTRRRRAAQ